MPTSTSPYAHLRSLVLCLAALALPCTALAWGTAGHRVVGLVAEQGLSPKASAAVREVLAGESLADVANWMDEVRSTPEGKAMRPWHYDRVDACLATRDNCPNDDCATKRIELAVATLRGNAGTDDKRKALKVLVHLVGDLHQPLHAAENDDHGGNEVTISNRMCQDFASKKDMPCNLHSYWDTQLVRLAIAKSTETQFAKSLGKINVAPNSNPATWLRESNTLAKTKAHNYQGFACKVGKNEITLDAAYDAAAVRVVRRQLGRAGARLAVLLNDIYR